MRNRLCILLSYVKGVRLEKKGNHHYPRVWDVLCPESRQRHSGFWRMVAVDMISTDPFLKMLFIAAIAAGS